VVCAPATRVPDASARIEQIATESSFMKDFLALIVTIKLRYWLFSIREYNEYFRQTKIYTV
jgi:hypothetical protein